MTMEGRDAVTRQSLRLRVKLRRTRGPDNGRRKGTGRKRLCIGRSTRVAYAERERGRAAGKEMGLGTWKKERTKTIPSYSYRKAMK